MEYPPLRRGWLGTRLKSLCTWQAYRRAPFCTAFGIASQQGVGGAGRGIAGACGVAIASSGRRAAKKPGGYQQADASHRGAGSEPTNLTVVGVASATFAVTANAVDAEPARALAALRARLTDVIGQPHDTAAFRSGEVGVARPQPTVKTVAPADDATVGTDCARVLPAGRDGHCFCQPDDLHGRALDARKAAVTERARPAIAPADDPMVLADRARVIALRGDGNRVVEIGDEHGAGGVGRFAISELTQAPAPQQAHPGRWKPSAGVIRAGGDLHRARQDVGALCKTASGTDEVLVCPRHRAG